jgi:hypothetical protein
MLRDMERDRQQIEDDISYVVYYMNGGLNFTDAYALSVDQIHRLNKTITDHFERQNEAIKNAKNNKSPK